MRLKQIKLAGFKSFVDLTTVPFPAQMTAIVGPNGCGKSNIIDAVRWVLGESSAKNLRGDAMTDVIFNGSSSRKPVSQASIELVFDNSAGRLQGTFAAYTEIAIKRLVSRDATSHYFLNGTKCRKKDITELFLGTGLGPRSYAIIEQGMISRLIESKPQELRVFIEEAAGISKYKERRRETENRIRHSRDNLERLDDVRVELQQQLEKLDKQAVAAKRFKDLKKDERRYKSEYSALRWIRLTARTESIDQDIKKHELELDSLSVQQSGRDNHLTSHKTKQAELKHALDEINQQRFQLAQVITKTEQQQLHLKDKKATLIRDRDRLSDDKTVLTRQVNDIKIDLAELKVKLDAQLPEQTLFETQLKGDEAQLVLSEQAYNDVVNQWQQYSEQYYQLENQIKTSQSRLSSLEQLMAKTESRISTLNTEIEQLVNQEEVSPDTLVETIEQLKADQSAHQITLINTQTQFEQLQVQQCQLQQRERDMASVTQKLKGKMSSIETLIERQSIKQDNALAEWLAKHDLTVVGDVISTITVEKGWEHAVSNALGAYQQGLLIESTNSMITVNDIPFESCPPKSVYLFDLHYAPKSLHENYDGTLADKVSAPAVILNMLVHITLDENATTGHIVTNQLGHLSGAGWCYVNATSTAEQSDNLILLKKEQRDLTAELKTLTVQHDTVNAQLNTVLKQIEHCKQAIEGQQQQAHTYTQDITIQQNQLVMLKKVLDERHQRVTQLKDDLSQQHASIESEAHEKHILRVELDRLKSSVVGLEAQKTQASLKKESLRLALASSRNGLEARKTQLHQLMLSIQTTQSEINSAQQNLKLTSERLTHICERETQLCMSIEDIEGPLEASAITLQENLEAKTRVEDIRREQANKLADVENLILDVESGQSGVFEHVQKLKDAISTLKVERQGYHVRANSVLEVLDEAGQNIKEVLECLPAHADEDRWQFELEKTTNAISRLGAINLAAIEEFEHQRERKQYLDAQHQDLSSALETLEDAIKKIDRETKAKFKQTFDSINDDLQRLFPKVFGGGSAELELTGDDLLDAGVTIMARPPGKRNSTIHLLSGGEKALTALSLVFAIFRLNPAPFCMLDEVDAPLDDANVGRFCRLVNEMSENVQFIFISHNKIAMEMATNLVGVTMQEPGCSRMVAVDVEKAIELAEAS